ncbi:MAG: hypothetical protein M1822_000223 [Bathelium mastoideum]|nr:MAG: hypothetical protein M1822_000223 [Bathelium mastoideum]
MASGKATNNQLTSSKLFDVSHVTAIVTGGGTGIGLMITQALVANGAKVYITGRRQETLENAIKQYSDGPGSLLALPGDISQKSEVERLAKEVEAKEPSGIHLLVNNAGIARDSSTKYDIAGEPDMNDPLSISKHFMNSPEEAWAETYKTNVTAGFYMSMAFLPLLAKGNGVIPGYTSSVVNISSVSGYMKRNSRGQFAYATSKAAFTHLTRNLASTFVGTKVRVNAICPGLFPSEMTAGSSGDDNKSDLKRAPANPAERAGNDFDMAASILLLAGPGGAFYNEQFLWPDGGSTLANPAAR